MVEVECLICVAVCVYYGLGFSIAAVILDLSVSRPLILILVRSFDGNIVRPCKWMLVHYELPMRGHSGCFQLAGGSVCHYFVSLVTRAEPVHLEPC